MVLRTPTPTENTPPPNGFNNTALVASQVGVWFWASQVGRYRPPSGILQKFIEAREEALSKVICEIKSIPSLSTRNGESTTMGIDIDTNAIPYAVVVQTSTHADGFFAHLDTTTFDPFTHFMTIATLGYYDFMDICPRSSPIGGVLETDRPIATLDYALNSLAVWGYVGTNRWVLGLSAALQESEVDVEATALGLMCISEIISDLTVQLVLPATTPRTLLKHPSATHRVAADEKMKAIQEEVRSWPLEKLSAKVSRGSLQATMKAARANGAAGLDSIYSVVQHFVAWQTVLQASPIANTQYRTCHIQPTAYYPATSNNTYGGLYGLFNVRPTGTHLPGQQQQAASSAPSPASPSIHDTTPPPPPRPQQGALSWPPGTPFSPSQDPMTINCRSSFVSFRATVMWMLGLGQGNIFTARRGLPQHPADPPTPAPYNPNDDPSFFDLHRTTVLTVAITSGCIVVLGAGLAVAVQVWRARAGGAGFYDSALDVEGIRDSHYTVDTQERERRKVAIGRSKGAAVGGGGADQRGGANPRGSTSDATGTAPQSPIGASPIQDPGRMFGSSRADSTAAGIVGQEEDPSGGLGFF